MSQRKIWHTDSGNDQDRLTARTPAEHKLVMLVPVLCSAQGSTV